MTTNPALEPPKLLTSAMAFTSQPSFVMPNRSPAASVQPQHQQQQQQGAPPAVTAVPVPPQPAATASRAKADDKTFLKGLSSFFKSGPTFAGTAAPKSRSLRRASKFGESGPEEEESDAEEGDQRIADLLHQQEDDDEDTAFMKKYVRALKRKEQKATLDYFQESEKSVALERKLAEEMEVAKEHQALIEKIQQLHILRPSDELILHYDPLTACASVVGCPPFLKRALGRRSKKEVKRREEKRVLDSEVAANGVQQAATTARQRARLRKAHVKSKATAKVIHTLSSSSSSESSHSSDSSFSASDDEDKISRRNNKKETSKQQSAAAKEVVPLGIRCVTSCGPYARLADALKKTASDDGDRLPVFQQPTTAPPIQSPPRFAKPPTKNTNLPTYTNFLTPSFCTFCGCRYARVIEIASNKFVLPTFCTKCGRAAPRYLVNDLPPQLETGGGAGARVHIEGLYRHDEAVSGPIKIATNVQHEPQSKQSHVRLEEELHDGASAIDHSFDLSADLGIDAVAEAEENDRRWADSVLDQASTHATGPQDTTADEDSPTDLVLAASARSRYHRRLAQLGRAGLCDGSAQTFLTGPVVSRTEIDAEATLAMNSRMLLELADGTADGADIMDQLLGESPKPKKIATPPPDGSVSVGGGVMGSLTSATVASELLAVKEMRARYEADLKRIVTATIAAEQNRNATQTKAQKEEVTRLTQQVMALETQSKRIAEETELRIRNAEPRLHNLWKKLIETVDDLTDEQMASARRQRY